MAELKIGLEGVAVAETQITYINGGKGQLVYRGHKIEDVVNGHGFEEVVYLLWNARYPNADELQAFKLALAAERALPVYLKEILDRLPHHMDMVSVVRTAVSCLTLEGPSYPPTQAQAMAVLAKIPTMITYVYNRRQGRAEVEPNLAYGHVQNYLYMLQGKVPEEAHVKALEAYLILSSDHDMNASTFTARVVTSTESDIISAITAAIGALKGPLHGGAPSEVDNMLDDIATKENVEPWLRARIEAGERIMGFGHRVYKAYDPRAAALKKVVEKFAHHSRYFDLSMVVEKVAVALLEEYKPGRNLYPNVEFWASGVLREIDLPPELYTPTFCVSRTAGWSTQIMEQAAHNRLIRPSSIYTGALPVGA